MDKNVQTNVLQRLSIIEGHVKKVKEMVAEEAYCPDVIHQSHAIQAALKKVDEELLHGHLHTCVLGSIHGDNPRVEKVVDELVDLFRKKD